ncbi:DUF418 domain-containing protein [Antrihabitans sp. YC3-6]|uniref:DUF418 domain-containing protein n=1 Tax=Antrihabitans stalagmiti TaxID=2799499 RepID=A0A934NND9_9NOCA|nr:DUF418 domain-containing protein [Antrihabitans stalagmiti]MBJ8338350.1 DUF418 domain-containing protein [Antrihabitans stalagmiti]
MITSTPASTASSSRLMNVDALRGFALFGILAVNICVFADGYYGSGVANPHFDSWLDHTARFAVTMLFETKFYLLFSFLFGYSFTLQMASAERAGRSFRPRMLRRLGGLFVIGLLHGALLYHGEILSTYAVLGLILLAARRISPRAAIVAAASLIGLAGALWIALGTAAIASGGSADPVAAADNASRMSDAYNGSIGTVAGYHLGELPVAIVAIIGLQGAGALAMFLLGLAAGKVEFFADVDRYRLLLARILRFGLPIGLGGAAIYAYSATVRPGTGWEWLGFGISEVTGPLLTASYVALGLALFRTGIGAAVVRGFAPAGRMALSNYIGQSLVLGIVFTAYGFRLTGDVGPLGTIGIAVVVFCAQLWLSGWWLRSHSYGPAEWVLRAITIAGRPAWRR